MILSVNTRSYYIPHLHYYVKIHHLFTNCIWKGLWRRWTYLITLCVHHLPMSCFPSKSKYLFKPNVNHTYTHTHIHTHTYTYIQLEAAKKTKTRYQIAASLVLLNSLANNFSVVIFLLLFTMFLLRLSYIAKKCIMIEAFHVTQH